MAKVLVNETSLTSIADAIREKNGTAATYKPSEMAAAIAAIEVGGNDDTKLHWEGNLEKWNYGDQWNWYFEKYGSRITTDKITSLNDAFNGCYNIEEIPVIFRGMQNNNTSTALGSMFMYCRKLKNIGKFVNFDISSASNMFNQCYLLRELPIFEECVFTSMRKASYTKFNSMFSSCYSLRRIDRAFLEEVYNPNITGSYANSLFSNCYALDEIVGLSPQTSSLTSNQFSSAFQYCHRLKNLIFKTTNGTPYTANWKNQTIELYNGVGWLTNHYNYLTNYNSGITLDKEVTDQASYDALKNDPDWFSCHPSWSRFNHTSAVNLINSLPDTSAAVASGGTNSLVLRNQSGEYTDGGGCGDLTEEEIAVAAAKGWTITYKT